MFITCCDRLLCIDRLLPEISHTYSSKFCPIDCTTKELTLKSPSGRSCYIGPGSLQDRKYSQESPAHTAFAIDHAVRPRIGIPDILAVALQIIPRSR